MVAALFLGFKDNFYNNTAPLALPIQQLKETSLNLLTFDFYCFGEEPMDCDFDIRTKSDAFIVNYEVESTWVQGMPTNPCY